VGGRATRCRAGERARRELERQERFLGRLELACEPERGRRAEPEAAVVSRVSEQHHETVARLPRARDRRTHQLRADAAALQGGPHRQRREARTAGREAGSVQRYVGEQRVADDRVTDGGDQ
jgi:hypothetical protein